jgi:hypothetical protein
MAGEVRRVLRTGALETSAPGAENRRPLVQVDEGGSDGRPDRLSPGRPGAAA